MNRTKNIYFQFCNNSNNKKRIIIIRRHVKRFVDFGGEIIENITNPVSDYILIELTEYFKTM